MLFYGVSQRFSTTFNILSFAYNLPPSNSCYRPPLPIQIHDMGHGDDDNNNTNNNNSDDDEGNGSDHISQ